QENLEGLSAAVGERPASLRRFAQHLVQDHRPAFELELAAREAPDVHQIVDEAAENAQLAIEDLERRVEMLTSAAAKQGDPVGERSERVSQLVRGRREQAIPLLHRM